MATPDTKTIADLADFLDIPEARTAKAVFMMANIPEEKRPSKNSSSLLPAVIWNSMRPNYNALKASELRPATEEEIEAIGAVPGYASPIGIPAKNNFIPVIIVVDDLIPESTNLVAGCQRNRLSLI